LFFINATDKQDKDIEELRQMLLDAAFEHPNWGQQMPTLQRIALQAGVQVERILLAFADPNLDAQMQHPVTSDVTPLLEIHLA
jgi:hypothetical protein